MQVRFEGQNVDWSSQRRAAELCLFDDQRSTSTDRGVERLGIGIVALQVDTQ